MWPLFGRAEARKVKFGKRKEERNKEPVMFNCLAKAGGVYKQ